MRKLCRAMLLSCLVAAPLLAAGPGFMAEAQAATYKCKSFGRVYSPGQTMQRGGNQYICLKTGIWNRLGNPDSRRASCFIGKLKLRPGDTHCSRGVEILCGSDGRWGPTGNKC